MSDDKQLEAFGKSAPTPLPLTPSQFDELVRREEIADRKAALSRDAEQRARTAILINALIAFVALAAEVLRQYSAGKGHP